MLLQQLEQLEQQYSGNKNPAIPEGGALGSTDTVVQPRVSDTVPQSLIR
jgi:hypothetical protein